MNNHEGLTKELLTINRDIAELLTRIGHMPTAPSHGFAGWRQTCERIENQLSEELIRVAVIGAIKSGKSTLINALFQGDYLKRGAGVVTSMVTRVRRGDRLSARLYFKSWEVVNQDIERALHLFPSMEWRSHDAPFDIRLETDRSELATALAALESKHLLTNDTRNLNSLYLLSYLKGYERVSQVLSAGNHTLEYKETDFSAHREFSGNDTLAFYLKDIALEINTGEIESHIEIADCQGSDSPNPLHMAMIQDYLLVANLLIYVISSRTGIRQADLNFLSMIKKMGIMDSVVFVVNCDLSEHESHEELNRLIAKITADIAILKPAPAIYAYSALLSLFRAGRETLSAKDRKRLAQWEAETAMCDFLTGQEKAFVREFQTTVTRRRYALLFSNHSERLGMIINSLGQWIRMHQEVLTKGAEAAARLVKVMKSRQKKIDRMKSMVKSTLDGAVQQIKREIRTDADRFFDHRNGEVIPELTEFIKNDLVSLQPYRDRLTGDGFSTTMYHLFQEFKNHIDTFMTENANPGIFHFIREQEEKIKESVDAVIKPYEVMAADALARQEAALGRDESSPAACRPSPETTIRLDVETLKRENRLVFPPAAAVMNYSVAVQTEAVMRLGYYRFIEGVRRLFRRPAADGAENALAALADAVARMKRETLEGLLFHFKNYRENIKFQYLFRLVDILAAHVLDRLMERFHDYAEDLSALAAATDGDQTDKKRLYEEFTKAAEAAGDIAGRLARFEEGMRRSFPLPSPTEE